MPRLTEQLTHTQTHTLRMPCICLVTANCLLCVSRSVWRLASRKLTSPAVWYLLNFVYFPKHFSVFLTFSAKRCMVPPPPTHTFCLCFPAFDLSPSSLILWSLLFDSLSLNFPCSAVTSFLPVSSLKRSPDITWQQTRRVADRLFQEVFPVWRVSCSVFCTQIPHQHAQSCSKQPSEELNAEKHVRLCF